MKKLFLILSLLAVSFGSKAENEPTLILEVHFKNPIEAAVVNHYLNDEDFCCVFEVASQATDSCATYTQIKHKETGIVLGTFYGTPTKEFVLKIYREQLTPEYVEFVVSKLTNHEAQK